MNVTVREYLDQLYRTFVHCMGHRPAQMRISPELYALYSNELQPNQRFVTGVSDGNTIQEGLLFRGTAVIEDPDLSDIQVNWRALSTSTTADNGMFRYLESRGMVRRVAGTEISVPWIIGEMMKILHRGKDGGPESTVRGLWLIEIKSLFSIALLCFENGSREAYHSHAFNSVSWLLKGRLDEDTLYRPTGWKPKCGSYRHYFPSLRPIWTPRDRFHKVNSVGRSWVLTFRGPWRGQWQEYLPKEGRFVTLTNGRKELI